MNKWMRVRGVFCAALCVCAFALAAPASGVTHHIILTGSGGEAEFTEQFRDWGTRLRAGLVTRLGAAQDHVVLLSEPETASPPAGTTISLETIRALFKGLDARLNPADDVVLYLIGHGSYMKDESKFQIPGEDLSAQALEAMIAEMPAARVVVINGTSSSAGFINVLSGPNRVVCAATKSAAESNATEFMRFFVEGIEDGSADRNHDERISVLEACEQAAELTASWYTGSNLIATEHAILDDNGDGLGSRLPISSILDEAVPVDASIDGDLAGSIYLKDYTFPEDAPQDLIDRYLAALDAANALRERKGEMPETEYYAELERVLIDAARANREIHRYLVPPAAQD